MRLRATEDERALQEEVRSFLAQAPLVGAALPRALDDRMAVLREWQASCYEAGLVGRAWPSDFGGGGRPPVEQIIVDQELAAAGAPEFVNVTVLGPVGRNAIFGPPFDPVRALAVLITRTTWPFVPWTL